jgi:hypothetical protein
LLLHFTFAACQTISHKAYCTYRPFGKRFAAWPGQNWLQRVWLRANLFAKTPPAPLALASKHFKQRRQRLAAAGETQSQPGALLALAFTHAAKQLTLVKHLQQNDYKLLDCKSITRI